MESPFFTILINGTSKGFFKSSRSLKQGDVLFPFLFSLVTDGLSAILKKAEQVGLVKGFIIGDDSLKVSHLQFVDNTISFLNAKKENIKNMKMCLSIFEVIDGFSVNMDKSCMARIHVDQSMLMELASVMGCQLGALPLKYLEMPLGGNPKVVAFWDPVVKKVSKKFVAWKKSYISFGGHITLIKVALAKILVYYMSFFRMSCKVAKNIEMLLRNFLRGERS